MTSNYPSTNQTASVTHQSQCSPNTTSGLPPYLTHDLGGSQTSVVTEPGAGYNPFQTPSNSAASALLQQTAGAGHCNYGFPGARTAFGYTPDNTLSKLALVTENVGSGVSGTNSVASSVASSGLGSLPTAGFSNIGLGDADPTAVAVYANAYNPATQYHSFPSPYTSPYTQQFQSGGFSGHYPYGAAMQAAYAAHSLNTASAAVWMGSGFGRGPYDVTFGTHGGKKGRQTYHRCQTTILESQYKVNKYVTKQTRRQLSEYTGLSDRQIKIWFQNRRMKEKKDKKKAEEERQLNNESNNEDSMVSPLKSESGHHHGHGHGHGHSSGFQAPQQVELQASTVTVPATVKLEAKPPANLHQPSSCQRSLVNHMSSLSMLPTCTYSHFKTSNY